MEADVRVVLEGEGWLVEGMELLEDGVVETVGASVFVPTELVSVTAFVVVLSEPDGLRVVVVVVAVVAVVAVVVAVVVVVAVAEAVVVVVTVVWAAVPVPSVVLKTVPVEVVFVEVVIERAGLACQRNVIIVSAHKSLSSVVIQEI